MGGDQRDRVNTSTSPGNRYQINTDSGLVGKTASKSRSVLQDRQPHPASRPHKELTKRLLKGKCEICGQASTAVEIHQVRKLADLATPGQPQPAWTNLMAKMRRKTLVTCAVCHEIIHAGKPATTT
ncbi:MAG: hypothetical protein ACRDTG_15630 [Pseudonocardiaceae bacterium]